MTSPVSAIEAIERFKRAVRANGYRTSDDQTEAEYQAAKAAVIALARQAEALQRENAEKDARITALTKGLTPFARIADMTRSNAPGTSVMVNVDRCRDARALLGGYKNAE